jgi:LmbE family N-acetylglucosaminyl deacetylase
MPCSDRSHDQLTAGRQQMLSRTRLGVVLIAPLLIGAATSGAHPQRKAIRPLPRPTLTLGADTRLLVIAPHPDDEVIAAAGVIQRVRAANGALRIVYLTDGEGYSDSVRAEKHGATPQPSDYRSYGRERQDEARHALHILGVDSASLTFLGFPNNGLSRLMTVYWSERRAAFRSPYTRRNEPPHSEEIQPDVKFRGEDLTQELAMIIGEFRPTVILTPRKEDQHVDHCAAWFFVADALGDVRRVEPAYQTDLVTYIVHYYSWPFEYESPRLPSPPDLRAGVSGWINVPLTDHEVTTKRKALEAFKSQMKAMGWFLEGFARRNEVFSRPARAPIRLPFRHSPCDEFMEARQ